MKKKSTILLAVVSAACAVLVMDRLQAQPQPAAPKAKPTRVAVADVVAILDRFKRVGDVREKFKIRVAKIKAKREDMAKDIRSDQKFLRDEFKPNTPEHEMQLAKIRSKMIQLKVWEEVQAAANDREQYVTTLGLHEEVLGAISAEAKLRGIDIVLHNPVTQERAAASDTRKSLKIHSLLYAAAETDLTETVLKKLNDRYKKQADK